MSQTSDWDAFRASFTGRLSRHVQLGGDWEETQKSLLGLCVTWGWMPQDPPSGADEHCLGEAGGNVNLYKGTHLDLERVPRGSLKIYITFQTICFLYLCLDSRAKTRATSAATATSSKLLQYRPNTSLRQEGWSSSRYF